MHTDSDFASHFTHGWITEQMEGWIDAYLFHW